MSELNEKGALDLDYRSSNKNKKTVKVKIEFLTNFKFLQNNVLR